MPKPIKKSSLPTLPKIEHHGEVVVRLGGKHGYKKVKLAPCGVSVGSQETQKHGNTGAAQEARNTETRKHGLMNWP